MIIFYLLQIVEYFLDHKSVIYIVDVFLRELFIKDNQQEIAVALVSAGSETDQFID